jgi:putative transcriptional regulator
MASAHSELKTPLFLLAMPQVLDPFFRHAVVLLVHHDAVEGSLGFIVNRPTELKLKDILEDLEIPWLSEDSPYAFFGGPVRPEVGTLLFLDKDQLGKDRLDPLEKEPPARTGRNGAAGAGRFVPDSVHLESAHLESAHLESDPLDKEFPLDGDSPNERQICPGVSASQNVSDLETLEERPEDSFRLYLGYAGWGEGQLELEILRNDWLIAPVLTELIFSGTPEETWRAALVSVGVNPDQLPMWTQHSDSEPAAN